MSSEIISAVCTQTAKEVDTKWGRKLVASFKLNNGNQASVWKDPSNQDLRGIALHQQCQLLLNDRGKYDLVKPYEGGRVNGLHHVSQPLEKIVEDLDIPELLTEEQRVKLKAVIKQRAKLLKHCIDVMETECGDIDDSRGVRSLGVTLFIHVTKFID